MHTYSARRSTLWSTTGAVPVPGPLTADTLTEVCVIGAGIAGLTTAYLLAREGRQVVVLDDGQIAGGNTQRTTAHLTAVLDRRFVELERMHGADRTRQIVASHATALDCIEGIVRFEKIPCDFSRTHGYLFNGPEGDLDALQGELLAAQRAGHDKAEWALGVPIPGFNSGPCIRFPRQAQFHPTLYAAGLVKAILREGGQIFTNTRATAVEGGRMGYVYTGAGPVVTADHVVLATHSPIGNRFAIQSKQSPYLSYVIGALIPPGSVPHALYWDTEEPGHYARVQSLRHAHLWEHDRSPGAHDILLIGGEDHRTGQVQDQSDRYARLEQWARARFPMIESIRFRWSGQILNSVDGLGFIGRNPGDAPNVLVATGDSGNGMTHGTLAGMIISDLVAGRENLWAGLYSPSRRTLRAAGTYVRDNLNSAAHFASGWLTPGDVERAESLPPDCGAVIRFGLTKVAVYRDPRGMLHQRSAVCPHLGAIVSWNQADRTFDCPCHGCRFDAYGELLNGPANRNLAWVYDVKAPHSRPAPELAPQGDLVTA